MSRTVFRIAFSDFKRADDACKTILISNGFKRTIVNSERIWKKGGMLIGGQCLKVEYSDNHIIISAWITPFLEGNEEYSLEGITAIIPKRNLLSVIEQIKLAILEQV